MTSWFDKGRPALIEALNTICHQIDEDLTTELQPKQDLVQQHNELTALYEKSQARLEVIEKENVELRRKTLHQIDTDITSVTSTPQQPPTSSSIENGNPKVELVKLFKRYNALSENFKIAKAALDRRKDERNYWKNYAHTLEEVIHAAERDHNIKLLNDSSTSDESLKPTETTMCAMGVSDSFTEALQQQQEQEQEQEQLPPMRDQQPISPTEAIKANQPLSAASTAPESTQGDSDPINEDQLPPQAPLGNAQDVYVKDEPSSDGPSVVWERPVKRKREGPPTTGSPAAVRVKKEVPESSSPIAMGTPTPRSQESLDLDDIGQRMMTPRKRNELDLHSIPHTTISAAAAVTTPRISLPSLNAPHTTKPVQSSVLTPLSVNRRVIRSGGDVPNWKMKQRILGNGLASLAEDGENYGLTPSNIQARPTPSKSRLNTLLNTRIEEETVNLSSTTPRLHRQAVVAAAANDLNIPQRRALPFENGARPSIKRTVASPRVVQKATLKSPEKGTPTTTRKSVFSSLRGRPISELRLDDFKINAATNDGFDFAYSEVVREKNDRACLSGCTDMHCCGKEFRALALSQRPNPPLTPIQHQEEQRLLETYLGDAAYRLTFMSPPERAEVWVEAKTQELANKYGKHRHHFSRARSPPGFWNADFPSTQDMATERQEAAKRERQVIAERYREAMRPGGRWLFRDE